MLLNGRLQASVAKFINRFDMTSMNTHYEHKSFNDHQMAFDDSRMHFDDAHGTRPEFRDRPISNKAYSPRDKQTMIRGLGFI